MGRVAFVFPGQGSQKVGMGRTLLEADPSVGARFDEATAILGWDLLELCLNGPEANLGQTQNTQPALFGIGAIAAEVLRRRGWSCAAAAGHSLGEYSALAAAGVFTFSEGMGLVRRRGELMAAVGDRTPGGMAAVLNLSAEQVAAACAEVSDVGCVQVANYNSPDQTVISGEISALEAASALLKSRGARRVIRLGVSAPFHSKLMAPLQAPMGDALDAVRLCAPTCDVVANVTADLVHEPCDIRGALLEQLAGSVRWTETVQKLASMGITDAVEVGPGNVLGGLIRKIEPAVRVWTLDEALQADPPA